MSHHASVDRLSAEDLRNIGAVELLFLCAQDTSDSELWSEFLRRFTPRIKDFIRGTLRQSLSGPLFLSQKAVFYGGFQEGDLFQNTIIRLVENDCAAMKRFTGTSEEQLLAYLAVIARSVVRDSLRRQKALKRPICEGEGSPNSLDGSFRTNWMKEVTTAEREVLVRELRNLSSRTIKNLSGQFCARDQIVFDLYYFQGLSINQIAQCKSLELSKTGIEKLLNRLMDRIRAIVNNSPAEEMLG